MSRREAARRKGNLFDSLTHFLLTSHNCFFGMTIARTLGSGTSSSKSQPSQLGSRAFPQQKQDSKSQNKAIRRRARTASAHDPPVPRGHGSGESTGPERASSWHRPGSTERWHLLDGATRRECGGKGGRRALGRRAMARIALPPAGPGTAPRKLPPGVAPSVSQSVSQSVCRARPASLTYSRTRHPAAASKRVSPPGANLRARRAAGTESLVH